MRCTAEARCVEGRVGVLLELAKGVHCLVHGAHACIQAYHTPTHLKKELHRSRSRGAQHARDLTPTTLRAPPFISTPSGASAFLRLAYVSAGRPSFHDRYGDSIDVMKGRRTLGGFAARQRKAIMERGEEAAYQYVVAQFLYLLRSLYKLKR